MGQSNEMEKVKASNFKRIAQKRTERILDSLRLLGQCSNRRTYIYTEDQVEKIFREIRNAVREAETQFKVGKKEVKFEL